MIKTSRLLLYVLLTFASVSPGYGADLIDAARNEDSERLRSLLAQGANPNEQQADGATALHWAVHRGDSESVLALLSAGANVNQVNRLGASPLFVAARNGDGALIRQLLEAGAEPDLALQLGETPLMSAARAGTAEGVRALIAAGADVNSAEQSRKQTALMWAVSQGHVTVARLLIEAGANLEARSSVRPMLMFVDGANGGAFDQGVMENLGGYSPLLFAARNGDVAMVRLLLDFGVNVDGLAGNGASPLVVAAHSGHADVATLLLEGGADPNSMEAGYSALHAAILRGDEKLVAALLEAGANANARVEKATPVQRASEDWVLRTSHVSATPYWLAANFREPSIMRVLYDHGADPLLTNDAEYERLRDRESRINPPRDLKIVGGYRSALQAAIAGDSTRGRFYVQANPDPVKEERLTLETARTALNHGVSLEHLDFNDANAMHDAAGRNLGSVVELLIGAGADANARNGRGQTPLDLAIAIEARLQRAVLNIGGPEAPGPSAREVLEAAGALKSEQLSD
jgi:ankyrin repeat protein